MSSNAQVFFNVLTVIAIVAGPIVAIQIQEHLEKGREELRRKIYVFRELMLTRGTMLSPRHVEALNGIQMEFSSGSAGEKRVIDAWQNYFTHLNNYDGSPAAFGQARELLAELLLQMATCLRYADFNKARIKSEAYIPKHLADIEQEQNALRRAAVAVFEGKAPLRVNVV